MTPKRSPSTKGKRYPSRALSPDEVRLLIKRIPDRRPTGKRNKALFYLMYAGGIRISEALALKVSDIDMKTGIVFIGHGKGDKKRNVAVNDSALNLIEKWIKVRRSLGIKKGPLFCSHTKGRMGRPLASQYVREALKRAATRAGLEGRVTPHAFRHGWAVAAMRGNVALNIIQKQLGHSSLATTTRYLDHISDDDLKKAAGVIEEL